MPTRASGYDRAFPFLRHGQRSQHTDLAQAMGTPFDDMDFTQIETIVDSAAKEGRWVIFVGHEIGERRRQSTDAKALELLSAYLKDATNGIWVGTVAEIGTYVRKQRGGA